MLKKAVMHRNAKYKVKAPMDSLKWCRYIVNSGYMCILLITISRIVWCFVSNQYSLNIPERYLKNFIIIPTIINYVLVLSADLFVRSTKIPIHSKEYLCSFLFVIISFYLVMTHDTTIIVISAFMIAVFISAVFLNLVITRWVFFDSIFCVILFGVKQFITNKMDSQTVLMIYATCIMLVCSYLLAKILIKHYHDNLTAIINSHEEAAKNELAFLQAQIKPHFLYNAITAIVSFCHTDSEKAADLLVDFSKYLRLTFDFDNRTMMIPLEKEIELIEAYVEIEKVRFGEKISVQYNIEPELLAMEVLSFCIQPLVENAIQHGLCKLEDGGIILISVEKKEGYVTIKVSDTGIGMGPEQLNKLKDITSSNEGVGFSNVNRRIKSWENAHLDIQSVKGEGTTVTITILDVAT